MASITPNWFSSVMQMMGPKQEVIKPPKPKPFMSPMMQIATENPTTYRMINPKPNEKKRRGSNSNLSSKRMKKPEPPSMGLFGESAKRKSGSTESLSAKRLKKPGEPSMGLFGESKKRKGASMFNPNKKMKSSLSSQKRSKSLGSLENMFSKKARV